MRMRVGKWELSRSAKTFDNYAADDNECEYSQSNASESFNCHRLSVSGLFDQGFQGKKSPDNNMK
jgi:hypothetical protein